MRPFEYTTRKAEDCVNLTRLNTHRLTVLPHASVAGVDETK